MKKIITLVLIVILSVACFGILSACGSPPGVIEAKDKLTILTELMSKSADVGIVDSTFAYHYLDESMDTEYSKNLMVIESFTLTKDDQYGIGVRESNLALLNEINLSMLALYNDGTILEIAKKYGLEQGLIPILDGEEHVNGVRDDSDLIDWNAPRDGDLDTFIRPASGRNGVLYVGYTLWEPMSYFNSENKLVGFDVEVAEAVAARLGLEVKHERILWANLVQELDGKSVDVIWNGMTITNSLTARIGISVPYMESKQVAIIRKADKDKYTNLNSLRDAKVVVENGSVGEEVARGVIFA